jgi:hypothetical protein
MILGDHIVAAYVRARQAKDSPFQAIWRAHFGDLPQVAGSAAVAIVTGYVELMEERHQGAHVSTIGD